MPTDCQLEVANATLASPKFIGVLEKVEKEACYGLDYDIISYNAQQKLRNSGTDAEALSIMREVFTPEYYRSFCSYKYTRIAKELDNVKL